MPWEHQSPKLGTLFFGFSTGSESAVGGDPCLSGLTPKSWSTGLGRFVLVFLLLRLCGCGTVIFQLSSFYCTEG